MARKNAYVMNLTERELVRGDLIERLERQGAADVANLDRVEKYMALWDLAAAHIRNREKRGLYVTELTQRGPVSKLNPSAAELVKVCGQMDKLYVSIENAKPKAPRKDDADGEL